MSAESINEPNVLYRLFRKNPQTEIISYFLEHPGSEPTVTELSHDIDVTRKTIYRNIKSLIEMDIIRQVEKKKYRLNRNHVLTRLLRILYEYDDLAT